MPTVDRLLTPHTHDLGGFLVGRVLPHTERRMVGPFIFLDHMGPADMTAGQAIDVRPHPHIGLSTLTYLFEGELFHRDSLGNAVEIVPGEVNWMTAGRGIAHSERTSQDERMHAHRVHGLQCWVALPKPDEETAPEFSHHAAGEIPCIAQKGTTIHLIAGEAYGKRSPVKVFSPLFYADVRLESGAVLALPDGYTDQAAYIIHGRILAGEFEAGPRTMMVFDRKSHVSVAALEPSHVLIFGGEPFPEERHIWWNFVSSSKARMEKAKADWKAGRFARIPGDDHEFIPLPE